MKIPKEVLVNMRNACHSKPDWLGSFQAVADVLVPYVLAEALVKPTHEEADAATPEGGEANPWDRSYNNRYSARLFANRLAALTAKPDPAVEAVEAVLHKRFPDCASSTTGCVITNAAEIVAAVDKARKEAL